MKFLKQTQKTLSRWGRKLNLIRIKKEELEWLLKETKSKNIVLKRVVNENDHLEQRNKGLLRLEKRFQGISQEQEGELVNHMLMDEIDRLHNVITAQQKQIKSIGVGESKLAHLEEPVFKGSWNPFKHCKRFFRYRKEKSQYNKLVRTIRKSPVQFITYKSDKYLKVENDGNRHYKKDYLKISDRHVETSDKFYRIYYLADIPAFLYPNLIFRLVNSPIPLVISSFVEPTSTVELKNLAKRRKSVLEAQQRERLKQQKGRDPDIDKSLDEIEQFLEELSNEVERGFVYSMYVAIEAWNQQQLIQTHKDFQDLTNTMGLTYNIYSYGQENAFKSMYPFDDDKVGQNRILQTTSTAYLLPFVSKEFADLNGVFVGVNMTNNSLVYLDPFACRNHNINIFGVSGGGKSVTAQVLASRMYTRGAQIIIIDPEGEYVDFTKRLGGEVISFSRSNGINPFYIANNEEEAIQDHIGVLKTFFKYFIPANKYDDAILDQKLMSFYFEQKEHTFEIFMQLMKGTTMFDYLNVLHAGSLRGIFNSARELDLNSNLITFDLRMFDKEDRRLPAMYLLTSIIWNLVNTSKNRKKLLFIDEAHKFLTREKEIAVFYHDIVKTARKRDLGIVSITQDVEDFVNNDFGKGIIGNSETKILLKQDQRIIPMLGAIFPLSEQELLSLNTLNRGEAVLFREDEHINLYVHRLPHEKEYIRFKHEDVT